MTAWLGGCCPLESRGSSLQTCIMNSVLFLETQITSTGAVLFVREMRCGEDERKEGRGPCFPFHMGKKNTATERETWNNGHQTRPSQTLSVHVGKKRSTKGAERLRPATGKSEAGGNGRGRRKHRFKGFTTTFNSRGWTQRQRVALYQQEPMTRTLRESLHTSTTTCDLGHG